MAFVINSLLTAECIFRIFTCLIAEPIKMIFLFLGWMPPFLSQFALVLEEIINYSPGENISMCKEEYVEHNSSISCPDKNYTVPGWFHFKHPDSENHSWVLLKNVEAICFIPTCISQFGTVGTCIFVMLISIVRYIFCKFNIQFNK